MGRKGGLWGFLKSLGRRGSAAGEPLAGYVKVELRPDRVEVEPASQGECSGIQPPPAAGAAEAALTEAITHGYNTYIRPVVVSLGADDSLIQHPTSRG